MRSAVVIELRLSEDGRSRARPPLVASPLNGGCQLALRPTGFDRVHRLLGAVAGYPSDDALEEGVSSDSCRHEVRTIKAEDRVFALKDLDAVLENIA
jgi:hypothetical protein